MPNLTLGELRAAVAELDDDTLVIVQRTSKATGQAVAKDGVKIFPSDYNRPGQVWITGQLPRSQQLKLEAAEAARPCGDRCTCAGEEESPC